MLPDMTNPWLEDVATPHQNARLTVIKARLAISPIGHRFHKVSPDLSKAILALQADLIVIEIRYRDVENYRATRSFAVVQLPAIVEILTAMAPLDPVKDAERIIALSHQIVPCLSASKKALETMSRPDGEAIDISLAVLEGQMGIASPEKSIAPLQGDQPARSGFLGRIGAMNDLARHAASSGVTLTQNASAAAAKTATDIVSGTRSKAQAGTAYIGNAIAGTVEETVYAATAPIAVRLNAAKIAILDTSMAAILNGGLFAVVFPPAVPFMVGLALLDAPENYARNVASLEKDMTAGRDARRKSRAEAATLAKQGLVGVDRVRMDTPYISLSIDADGRNAEGIILQGAHFGKRLDELSASGVDALRRFAPDQKTCQIVEAWQRRVAT